MPRLRRLMPLLVAALVIQGLVGVVPHTHRIGGFEAESDTELTTIFETEESAHDCLACSVHAPMVDTAASRGIVHGVEQAYSAPEIQWSISVLSPHRTANPRAPPSIV